MPSIIFYNAFTLSYLPYLDSKIITVSLDILALSGKYILIPIIISNQEDKSTFFSLFQPNLTTIKGFTDYL